MKLNKQGIQDVQPWRTAGYRLPLFNRDEMIEKTKKAPIWLHMGAGNIFRAFPAVMQQELLEKGLSGKGIIVCECFDEEIIPASFTPYDNLTLAVTLRANGTMEKKVVASIAEAFSAHESNPGGIERLAEIFQAKSLQMVSFTITEKGYTVRNPRDRQTIVARVTEGLIARYKSGGYPLALVSMDNVSQNGSKLKAGVLAMAKEYVADGIVGQDFITYLEEHVSYTWSMIDKITPRPSQAVSDAVRADGFEDANITETTKHTFVASFVNAEECQYLVVEDNFPNGRPPLEKAGLLFATRETVEKVEKMKVCTCLNPLHTILAVSGCLLGYKTIAEAMGDKHLVALVERAAYKEALPVVVHPGIIDPAAFLREVLQERLPNPFVPDTPQRIACDTSQKIPVRFGETLKARNIAGLSENELEAIPFFFALYIRYLIGVDDSGKEMALSPDPRLAELTAYVSGIKLGDTGSFCEQLKPILSDASVFGVDLYEGSGVLAKKVEAYFEKLIDSPGAVARELERM